MPLSIVVCAYLDERARNAIRAAAGGDHVQFIDRENPSDTQLSALSRAEVVFGNVPVRFLASCRNLKWLQLESVGFEYYMPLAGTARPFTITNLKGMFAEPAAETALAGLLALGRGLPQLLCAQAGAEWVELKVRPQTWRLHGRRALILGAGAIGNRLRVLLEAFACEVKMFARSNPNAHFHTMPAVLDAVPQCDILACCLPKTPETNGLVGRQMLEAMPARALFVNIGRGSVVDEAALVDVLQRERIGGAVLDVTHTEPLAPEHPLWRCPRTIITQHTAGGYDDELLDKARFFLRNLELYRRGDEPLNSVDVRKGY